MKALVATDHLSRFAVGIALLLACIGPARADPILGATVDFTNNQGTLTGFFQLDTNTATVNNWDLTASAFNCADPASCVFSGFPQTEYTPGNSTSSIQFVGVGGAFQGIFFSTQVFGSTSVLSFVMNCGGNNNDCIHNAAMGSSIPLLFAAESRAIVPIARSLSLASLDVTDPPGVLSFSVVSAVTPAPEPATALLLVAALGALIPLRRQRRKTP
jgi:hypothetical protein